MTSQPCLFPVLVLAFDSSPGLLAELRTILEHAPGLATELSVARLEGDELSKGQIEALARRHRAQAVFLTLPADSSVPSPAWRWWPLDAPPLFAVTAADDPDYLFALLRAGLTDFVRPPLTAGEIVPRLRRSLEHLRREPRTVLRVKQSHACGQIIGKSPALLAETRKIPLVARCDVNVLISGETGTGKELVARAIHYLSPRSPGPFVPVNCGAIPLELVENELFGHERSAFTGAVGPRAGLIEEADGGTLFLDEIDCLPPAAQVKLLRFLQEGSYRRLGSTRVRVSDARLVAATNTNVEDALARGQLRRDFYYRVDGIPITLPPLRERREDIPSLARHFLDRYTVELGGRDLRLSGEAIHALLAHDWPGNIRELERVIQRAIVLTEGDGSIQAEVIWPRAGNPQPRFSSFNQAKSTVVRQFEISYIEEMLTTHHGNISRAARAAKKSRRAFWELIRKHHIQANRFRGVPATTVSAT